jgi:hypothetical protein
MNGLLSKNKNPTKADHLKFGEVDKVVRINTRFIHLEHGRILFLAPPSR